MSAKLSLQNPYVIAALPRPIDHSKGRYVAGDVYGGAPGSKKRKRSELAVGVDGEGVNIYDISASRLITSYALPPQTSFTCSPCALRTRISKREVERKTYVSTIGPDAQITLFRDVTTGNATQTSTITHKLERAEAPVVFIGTVTAPRNSGTTQDTLDLLVIREDGEIQSLDGDRLLEKWISPAAALGRDATIPMVDAKVEFAQLTTAYAASQGILKDREGALALFPQEISEDGFNPDLLVLITKTEAPSPTRTIHVIALPRRSTVHPGGAKPSVESLLTSTIPTRKNFPEKATFGVHVPSGTIQQLSGQLLTTFDIHSAVPTELAQLKLKGGQSFLRLSSTSVMVSSQAKITVYSSKFNSVLTSIPLPTEYLDQNGQTAAKANQARTNSCDLVSYFPKLGTAVAIANNGLVAIQIEGKSRAAGLLIDSLGRSVRSVRGPVGPTRIGLSTMETSRLGLMVKPPMVLNTEIKALDRSVSAGDTAQFDSLMADKLEGDWGEVAAGAATNGELPNLKSGEEDGQQKSVKSASPSEVHRGWVIYALGQIFAWSSMEGGERRLTIRFYPPNVFMWLLRTGNMTVGNIESAIRSQIQESGTEFIPAGSLTDLIVDLDPQMDLLFVLISETSLGAAETLIAIRHLMQSLELLSEATASRQEALANGEPTLGNGDIDEQVEALEAEAEADIALAEYQLGPGSGVRGEALSLALSKLYTCPTNTTVRALQTTYTSQEIVSLVYLLRFEMARGAWTSRYLDDEQLNVIDNDTGAPDNTILLISSLLNNCIDAVGAGGWLTGHARLVSSDRFEAEELISSLKLEVSAALEGIEEAAYLKGLTLEMIRYSESLQGGSKLRGPGPEPDSAKAKKNAVAQNPMSTPAILPSSEQDHKFLPLGLKADQRISFHRVGAGGEVVERSARDIGRLKSHKVGKYTLERITI